MTLPAIGFIGLGRMGGGMALNLVKAVETLFVHDPFAAATEPLVAAGAIACDSPADIARRVDVIFVCVPFAPEVREVLFGSGGLAEAGRTGLTVVDTTTLDRTDAIGIAAEAGEAGIAYWDCPISGMPFRAADGTLTVMFGGSEDAFMAARPYLDVIGEFIVHCGPVGNGQAMKAINNIIYNINIAGICEILPLAAKVGLDPEQIAAVVASGSSRSFASDYFVPRIMAGDFAGDFTLEAAYKDIVNVQRMAIEHRAHIPVANAMIATYQEAIAAGYGDSPKSSMVKVYERALGLEFRHSKKEG